MTPEQQTQIVIWRQTCQFVDDLVKSCPPMTAMDELHVWFGDVHGWLVHIGTESARAEAEYSIAYFRAMESGINADALKVIKGSSTMTDRYIAGKNPELFEIWQRLKNLNRNLETILNDMRTNIVTLREADKREAMQMPAQTQSNGKREYVWPSEER
jgi:hypothetical protein